MTNRSNRCLAERESKCKSERRVRAKKGMFHDGSWNAAIKFLRTKCSWKVDRTTISLDRLSAFPLDYRSDIERVGARARRPSVLQRGSLARRISRGVGVVSLISPAFFARTRFVFVVPALSLSLSSACTCTCFTHVWRIDAGKKLN